MRTTRNAGSGIEAGVGYAADHRGRGVAYARLAGSEAIQLIRVGFRVGGPTISSERAVAYAALTAIARALVKRGLRDVRFSIGDAGFVEEISSGRGVGGAARDSVRSPALRAKLACERSQWRLGRSMI